MIETVPLGEKVLIIPTLNEKENIISLIEAFLAVDPGLSVLVADSDSPDRTAELVERHDWRGRPVRVLRCKRRQGRGAAVVAAYRTLQSNPILRLVGIADADFSHAPADWPRLLAASARADIVIASRYIRGSRIVGWPIKRRLFSGAANLLLRLTMRAGVCDYTNGYRLLNRRALDCLELVRLDADGFIMLSQELAQWRQQHFKIVEVPSLFINRRRGSSHLRFSLIWESLRVLCRLAAAPMSRVRTARRSNTGNNDV